MTHVYYAKIVRGKLYPKARREGKDVAYCNDVRREDGKVVNEYIGIVQVPKGKRVKVNE